MLRFFFKFLLYLGFIGKMAFCWKNKYLKSLFSPLTQLTSTKWKWKWNRIEKTAPSHKLIRTTLFPVNGRVPRKFAYWLTYIYTHEFAFDFFFLHCSVLPTMNHLDYGWCATLAVSKYAYSICRTYFPIIHVRSRWVMFNYFMSGRWKWKPHGGIIVNVIAARCYCCYNVSLTHILCVGES